MTLLTETVKILGYKEGAKGKRTIKFSYVHEGTERPETHNVVLDGTEDPGEAMTKAIASATEFLN